jgi:hypothetical protein
MGSTTILDVIGSAVTFGMLLLISLRLNASASEHATAYTANYLLQRNMVVLTVMLEEDLKSVGLGIPLTIPPILIANTNQFRFRRGPDIIDYTVGNPSELPETPNPNDRYLHRSVNLVDNRMNLGVTNLTFTYWRIDDPTIQLPTPLTDVGIPGTGNIGPIDVNITLQSPYKMFQGGATGDSLSYMQDASQYEMFWRQIRSVARRTQVQTP